MFKIKFKDCEGLYISNKGVFFVLNGELHREEGPAIEYFTGEKFWYKKGKLHNSLGPAIERPDGYEWHLDGIKMAWKAWCLKTALDLYDN